MSHGEDRNHSQEQERQGCGEQGPGEGVVASADTRALAIKIGGGSTRSEAKVRSINLLHQDEGHSSASSAGLPRPARGLNTGVNEPF